VTVDASSRDFPYRQLATQYRERIAAGTMGPKLPSLADLAQEAGVSHMTVQRALQVLKDEGILEGLAGRGVFVVQR
jgi:DNA-binding GntR family transcriptional regulator